MLKGVLQRVIEANVQVAGEIVGQIGRGSVLFLAIEQGDGDEQLKKMVRKVAGLRLFPDDQGRMNLSVQDVRGSMLVVSQFTLVADLKKGFRPSFARAEEPLRAKMLVEQFCQELEQHNIPVAQGQFAADMQVHLINDGPVTFWLEFPSV